VMQRSILETVWVGCHLIRPERQTRCMRVTGERTTILSRFNSALGDGCFINSHSDLQLTERACGFLIDVFGHPTLSLKRCLAILISASILERSSIALRLESMRRPRRALSAARLTQSNNVKLA
jgi:hypothetical protein